MTGRMRSGRKLGIGAAVVAVAALVPFAVGTSALGALVGFAESSAANTTTFSTKRFTTTNRVDLEAAPAPECDAPAADPVVVSETSQVLDPTGPTVTFAIGPADIMIGENQQTPYHVPSGDSNTDLLTTYETVVTQFFQATAAGESCAVVAAIRFTG